MAKDIGKWETIVDILVLLGVICQCSWLAFVSNGMQLVQGKRMRGNEGEQWARGENERARGRETEIQRETERQRDRERERERETETER